MRLDAQGLDYKITSQAVEARHFLSHDTTHLWKPSLKLAASLLAPLRIGGWKMKVSFRGNASSAIVAWIFRTLPPRFATMIHLAKAKQVAIAHLLLFHEACL